MISELLITIQRTDIDAGMLVLCDDFLPSEDTLKARAIVRVPLWDFDGIRGGNVCRSNRAHLYQRKLIISDTQNMVSIVPVLICPDKAFLCGVLII